MIPRYSQEEINNVWSEKNKFQKWLDIELAVVNYYFQKKQIPQKDYENIINKANFNPERIKEIENETNHDVIAFLTNVAENIGDSSRFVHLGLTSSDVVDTAFSLLIQEAGQILLKNLKNFRITLKEKALQYQLTAIMGRTHGVHAEPTTLGHKIAIWYEEITRNLKRLETALETTKVGKISGAVGNYAHIDPELEIFVMNKLNLIPAKASNQIIQRDRHAEFLTVLAIISGTLEKIATEIRALQKTEFNEIQEPFSAKQKGSSAMPHKKNPILCERVSGLARLMRGYALTALENQALWHERDISHSSTERVIFPDATIVLDYQLSLINKVITGMVVNQDQMQENIKKSYNVYYSQQLLLKLVEKGLTRENAYKLVQKNALKAFQEKIMFDKLIKTEKEITDILSDTEINNIFDFSKYTKNIQLIFDKVFTDLN